MTRELPKRIILPQDPKAQERLRRYYEVLQSIYPQDCWARSDQHVAVAVQILFLQELSINGFVVETEAFRVGLLDNNSKLYQSLQKQPYIFTEACIDLAWKCSHVRTD